MKTSVLVLRILLGLLFCLSGVFGFIPFTPPPQPGLAGAFQDVFFKSHYVQFVDGIDLIAGLCLVFNRYAPLALVALAAIIYNVLVFHITMQIGGIVPGLIALAIWFVVAYSVRSHFAPLLAAKTTAQR